MGRYIDVEAMVGDTGARDINADLAVRFDEVEKRIVLLLELDRFGRTPVKIWMTPSAAAPSDGRSGFRFGARGGQADRHRRTMTPDEARNPKAVDQLRRNSESPR